jgi:hypothetical protein
MEGAKSANPLGLGPCRTSGLNQTVRESGPRSRHPCRAPTGRRRSERMGRDRRFTGRTALGTGIAPRTGTVTFLQFIPCYLAARFFGFIMVSDSMSAFADHRVFISYAGKDGASLARRLQRDLTKEGLDAWLDMQRIRGGAVWSTEIEHEIDTRQVAIALLSPGPMRQKSAMPNSFAPSTRVAGTPPPVWCSAARRRSDPGGS